MDIPTVVNVISGVFLLLITAVSTMVWAKFSDLGASVRQNSRDISALSVTLASDYVKRTELSDVLEDISNKLDRIGELEVQISSHYAKKEDLKTLGENLGRKLDRIIERLEQKADRTEVQLQK